MTGILKVMQSKVPLPGLPEDWEKLVPGMIGTKLNSDRYLARGRKVKRHQTNAEDTQDTPDGKRPRIDSDNSNPSTSDITNDDSPAGPSGMQRKVRSETALSDSE